MLKTYKLKWTQNAKSDLLNIVEYIKRDSPSIAKEIYLKIKKQAQSSNFFPLKGRVVPELQKEGITLYREVITSPWRIIYKVGNDTVYIMAIIDSRQNVEELLLQKLLGAR
ncbi:MAG: toxin ParE1/3/4 [Sulfurimonas sp.]|jgi:toxin ParE1/3/4|uniref:type II toxin-antitoxin system RelE/ParE family toxin n=1 Tax=Sulfurimonas sp. TaxID=2022749 RepID=UPI0039E22236